jgi:hypothetical protein
MAASFSRLVSAPEVRVWASAHDQAPPGRSLVAVPAALLPLVQRQRQSPAVRAGRQWSAPSRVSVTQQRLSHVRELAHEVNLSLDGQLVAGKLQRKPGTWFESCLSCCRSSSKVSSSALRSGYPVNEAIRAAVRFASWRIVKPFLIPSGELLAERLMLLTHDAAALA